MVKLINGHTGTEMWVEEGRVEEYLKLGHKKPKTGKPGKAKPAAEKPGEEQPDGE